MFLFWGRYLRRHERLGTTFHVVLLVISIVAAVFLYRLAVATLRGAVRTPFTWKKVLTSRRSYETAAFACTAGVLLGLVSFGALQGVRSRAPILGYTPKSEGDFYDSLKSDVFYRPRTWIPRWMALIGCPPFANLTDAEVSQKKSTWSKKTDKNADSDSVIGAQLSGADLDMRQQSVRFSPGPT
jgi:hypothetical protein